MRMQVILDSPFARPGSAPIKGGKKGEFRDWTRRNVDWTLVSGGNRSIGPLHDPVTWYGINYTGTQITQWDFQNKGTHTSPARLSFVLKVPPRNLRPSVIYSVPCDRIVQRAYCLASQKPSQPVWQTQLRIFKTYKNRNDNYYQRMENSSRGHSVTTWAFNLEVMIIIL